MKKPVLTLVVFLLIFQPCSFADEVEETKYGNFLDQNMVNTNLILMNERVNSKISYIGNKIAKQTLRPDIKYNFKIINDDNIINAYATSGGFVYITTGLLNVLENQGQLAAVLAHEIHHICENHLIKHNHNNFRWKTYGVPAGGVLTLGLGFVLLVLWAKYGSPADNPVDLFIDSFGLGIAATNAIVITTITGYKKQYELEADLYAVKYMKRAGYNPNDFVDLLKLLQKEQSKLKKTLGSQNINYIPSLLNLAPGFTNRTKALNAAAKKANKLKSK